MRAGELGGNNQYSNLAANHEVIDSKDETYIRLPHLKKKNQYSNLAANHGVINSKDKTSINYSFTTAIISSYCKAELGMEEDTARDRKGEKRRGVPCG
jgi:hypothetical protein